MQNMEELHSCIIHVGETSNGNLKHFTPATFSKFRNSRKIWLSPVLGRVEKYFHTRTGSKLIHGL
jgi:hypothetical protein